MILPDYPIEKADQDQLKRFPLAKKVAEMISDFSGKESFVIGIEGKWGAGKTSFINLVLTQLDPDNIVYFTFNPWNFSDESSLLRDFFIKLSSAVEKITGKNTGKRMKEYAGKLSEVDLGISYEGFSINPLKLLKFWSPDTSVGIIRKELDTALSSIEKKIVVVIDDIDRLDKKETKLILKLVKLTADFPKTIFVLAYDRNRVEDRITEIENGLDGGAVTIKLSDFGLVKDLASDLTKSDSEYKGTIIDPTIDRQHDKFKNYDAKNEIYAIGCVLHFIFTGRKGIVKKQVHNGLWYIIDKCTNLDHSKRYSKVKDIIADVETLEPED